MAAWLGLSRAIDRFNERLGRGVAWLSLVMVLIGAYNAIVRYLGRYVGLNLSSNAYIELQWYMFSLLFLLGGAYALKQNAHVRVDVVFSRLSLRARTWINLLGTLIFLLPFSVLALWVSWPSVRNSWQVMEMSPDPGGLPRYPIKTMILAAFLLLVAQGVSEVIKQIALLRGDIEASPEESSEIGEGV
jgi:TRAP-type mannitol/chloroaromatic compound transport system permease small subunit